VSGLLVWVVTIIVVVLSLVTALAPWYFCSTTNGDPHRSGFKFQTAVIYLNCVMFKVKLFL